MYHVQPKAEKFGRGSEFLELISSGTSYGEGGEYLSRASSSASSKEWKATWGTRTRMGSRGVVRACEHGPPPTIGSVSVGG